MRALVVSLLVLVFVVPPLARAQTRAPDPAAVLAAAREALGGEKRLAAVRSFVATGRTRQIQGDNLVPIEFEISCELPARYIRRDEIPARDSGPTTVGFNGADLVQVPAPPAPPGAPPPPQQAEAMRQGRAIAAKQDFARLMLGMFAASFEGYPLTFTYVGEAEAPQGKADVLEATGAPNFVARLFIRQDTHLPVMVTWQGPGAMPGRPGPPGAPGPPGPPGPPGKPAEMRLYYADYREVDGMKFPFRLRRAIGADTIEETTFDRFRINARIDARKFEAAR